MKPSQYFKYKEYKFWYLIIKFANKRLTKIERSTPTYHRSQTNYKSNS